MIYKKYNSSNDEMIIDRGIYYVVYNKTSDKFILLKDGYKLDTRKYDEMNNEIMKKWIISWKKSTQRLMSKLDLKIQRIQKDKQEIKRILKIGYKPKVAVKRKLTKSDKAFEERWKDVKDQPSIFTKNQRDPVFEADADRRATYAPESMAHRPNSISNRHKKS